MAKTLSKTATAKVFDETAKTATAETVTAETATAETGTENEPMNPPTEIIEKKDTVVVMADKKAITAHLKALDECFKGVEKTFFRVAFNLHWFYKTNAYCEINGKSYANIEQFARDRYGISKPTTYNYINIVDKFGKPNENGDITELLPCYKDFSSTKLLCMLNMDDDTLMKCTPKMTVAEIKKLLAESKGIECKEDTAETAEMADSEKTEKKSVTRTTYANSQELYSIETVEDLESHAKEIMDALKKALSQNNGTDYGISIQMFW